ncbi:hypothetical protein PMI21_00219 [Pseudomonas sp. GM18]|uniref:hypothetical protein n=1 Tax=Pseudomonas sp. GM18 TaxID=1144324 RepID=UPI0002723672|nr:hypothetical protein [Pseudomonas sp. GM18]EJM22037.1 hypothetical protein PMI21_00219 [Pseudomonas sp. GM18]
MLSGKIGVTLEVPDQLADEEGVRPFICIDTTNIVDAAIGSGLPDHSPLLNLLHQAGTGVDFQDLLEEYVMSWEPESRPAAADAVANWLEGLAKLFRKGSEKLSLDLKPRVSAPRN